MANMLPFSWTIAYNTALQEPDPFLQNSLTVLALGECNLRLSELSHLPPRAEFKHLHIALADLRVFLRLSRKYGNEARDRNTYLRNYLGIFDTEEPPTGIP